jgi:hypothetical protein
MWLMKKRVPKSLRNWFFVHFVADMLFAIPLIFFPNWFLSVMGFTVVDPVMSGIVGAALVGIGGTSFLVYNKGVETFDALVTLKIVWSWVAILVLFYYVVTGGPWSLLFILLVFVVFSIVWMYYKRRLLNA